jgi:hypothetical protein
MRNFKGKLLAADKDNFFIINGSNIEKYNHAGSKLIAARLKLKLFDNINLYPKFLSRIFRRGVIGGISGQNSILLWTRREIRLIDKSSLVVLRCDSLEDGRYLLNPCCIQQDEKDVYFFGDYFSNPRKKSCTIWRYDINGAAREIDFIDGEINHIHAVIPISDKNFVVLTGDFGDSAAIWKYNFLDKKIVRLVGGEQIYRGCVGFCEDGYLYYATDTTSEENAFIKLNISTAESNIVESMPASVIYGDFDANKKILCFSTNLEASLDTRNKWNKWITRKIPVCFRTDKVLVYQFFKDKIKCIYEAEPSRLPYRLFQYPSCIVKVGGNYIYISGLSTENINNITIQMPIEV